MITASGDVRQRRRTWPLLITLVAIGLFVSSKAHGEASLQAVSDAYEAQEKALNSFYVKYKTKSRLVDSAANATKYLNVAMLVDEIHTFAFKANKRYYSVARTSSSADISAKIDSLSNPGTSILVPANSVVAFDGKTLRKRNSGGQTASIGVGVREPDDAGYFNPEYMGIAFKVLPDVINVKNSRAANRMAGAIKSGKAKMRPSTEDVDGVNCVVVDVSEPLFMTFWCDPSKGYAVRKQEGCYPESRVINWRVTCSDFAEVCDGTWFPKRATTEKFAGPTAPSEIQNRSLLAYDLTVSEIHANDVPDKQFDLTIPVGTIVHNYERGKPGDDGYTVAESYHMPADENTLDQTSKQLNERQLASQSSRWRSPFLIINVVVVVIGALVFLVIRYRKAATSK